MRKADVPLSHRCKRALAGGGGADQWYSLGQLSIKLTVETSFIHSLIHLFETGQVT